MQGQVGGREDTNAVLVVSRSERTPDDQLASKLDLLAINRARSHVKLVVDAGDGTMCGGGDVSGNDLGKGHFVHAILGLERLGLPEKVPFKQVGDLGHTLATPVLHRPLGGGSAFEIHDDAGESGLRHYGGDLHLSGDQGAGGDVGRIMHEDGWRFHVQPQLDRLGRRCRCVGAIACMFVFGQRSLLGLGLFAGVVLFGEQRGAFKMIHARPTDFQRAADGRLGRMRMRIFGSTTTASSCVAVVFQLVRR